MLPTVQICELDGVSCGSILATFTTTSGPDGELVEVSPEAEHYRVFWHTADFGLEPEKIYRVSVEVYGMSLGVVDIQTASSGAALRDINRDEYLPLSSTARRTLPITFRIEDGVLPCFLPTGILDYYDTNGDGQYTTGEPRFGFDASDHGKLLKLDFGGSSDQGPPACQNEPVWDETTQTGVWNANPDVDYCNSEKESWSCWYQTESSSNGGGGGAGVLGDQILGNSCNELTVGQTLWQASASGEKQSLVSSDYNAGGPGSFADLINLDLEQSGGVDLVWCPVGEGGDNSIGCPMRGNCSGSCVTESPRLRASPILDPETASGDGANNTFNISGFTGVFIEKVACNFTYPNLGGPAGNWNVYVRLMF